jgi:hypothetical protein
MLLDPPHALFEFADDHAMADDSGALLDDGPSEPYDLLTRLLLHRQHV